MHKYILIVLLMFSSCNNTENDLVGSWNLSGVKYFNDFKYSTFNIEDIHLSITFSKDGNFIFASFDKEGNAKSFEELSNLNSQFDKDPVHFGRWKYSEKDSIINLNFHKKNSILKFKLDGINKGKLNLITNKENSSDIRLNIMFNRVFKENVSESENNYISLKLNSWRIKSKNKETPSKIIERTIESLKFALAFFNYHKENKLTRLDKSYLKPIPIVFARNGVAYKENKNWENIFFDLEDYDLSIYFLKEFFESDIPKPKSEKSYDIKIHYIKEYIKILNEQKNNFKQ